MIKCNVQTAGAADFLKYIDDRATSDYISCSLNVREDTS